MAVPEVLLSGDHGEIARWRMEQAIERTRRRRPDLLEAKPENGENSNDNSHGEDQSRGDREGRNRL